MNRKGSRHEGRKWWPGGSHWVWRPSWLCGSHVVSVAANLWGRPWPPTLTSFFRCQKEVWRTFKWKWLVVLSEKTSSKNVKSRYPSKMLLFRWKLYPEILVFNFLESRILVIELSVSRNFPLKFIEILLYCSSSWDIYSIARDTSRFCTELQEFLNMKFTKTRKSDIESLQWYLFCFRKRSWWCSFFQTPFLKVFMPLYIHLNVSDE